jgi:predicted ABC-type ATPase
VPKVYILAGPNGAGKTTFAREFLPHEAACRQFVNADLIAYGISPLAPETAEVSAGRAMIRRLDELTQAGEDLALETTLSGRWLHKRILDWKANGYFVDLRYLSLETADLAVMRVRQRVSQGGHGIPEITIRRRFYRSLVLLEKTYKASVHRWFVYDNSETVPVLKSFGENI